MSTKVPWKSESEKIKPTTRWAGLPFGWWSLHAPLNGRSCFHHSPFIFHAPFSISLSLSLSLSLSSLPSFVQSVEQYMPTGQLLFQLPSTHSFDFWHDVRPLWLAAHCPGSVGQVQRFCVKSKKNKQRFEKTRRWKGFNKKRLQKNTTTKLLQ